MRILLVEDEPQVAAFVEQGLNEEGYQVSWVADGSQGLALALSEHFDLILLDIRLPGLSGLEVCRQLRLFSPSLPILMLTALDAVEDRVAGLRAGADDYLPKPFAFSELLARIDALNRRAQLVPSGQTLEGGRLVLDPAARVCRCGDVACDLTLKEFDLLAYFLARKEQVLSRDDIHRDGWGLEFARGTNLIDVYVGYVRRKLHEAGSTARFEAVRGIGYRFVANDEPDRS